MAKQKSLLRRFSLIFIGIALVPFLVLYYLYAQFQENQKFAALFSIHFGIILSVIGAILLLGYFLVRLYIRKLDLLRSAAQKAATESITEAEEKLMLELAEGEGEIADLAKSLLSIIKQNAAEEPPIAPSPSEKPVPSAPKPAMASLPPDKPAPPASKPIAAAKHPPTQILPATAGYNDLLKEVIVNLTDAIGAHNGALFSFDNGNYVLASWVSRNNVTGEQIISDAEAYFDQIEKKKLLFFPHEPSESGEKASVFSPPLVCSPLVHQGSFLGALFLSGNVYWRNMENFSNEHLAIIVNVSRYLAASFGEVAIHGYSERALFEVLVALALAVEARDPYSRGHAERVSQLAQKIGELMGMTETNIAALRDAALLHDIGKKGIKYGLLFKSGKLSEEELATIRNHPFVGEKLVSVLKSYSHLRDPIRHHHEYLDGSGYPDGLKEKNISLLTKIIAAANMFDVLQMQRPYRTRLNDTEIKKEMETLVAQNKLDKKTVECLFKAIKILKQDQTKAAKPSRRIAGRKNLIPRLLLEKNFYLKNLAGLLRKNKKVEDADTTEPS